MLKVDVREQSDWLALVVEAVRHEGAAAILGVLDDEMLGRLRAGLYKVREHNLATIGEERLARAGERGVLRVMGHIDPVFFELLELKTLLSVIDAIVGPTAIMHLQNGFIVPSDAPGFGLEIKEEWLEPFFA